MSSDYVPVTDDGFVPGKSSSSSASRSGGPDDLLAEAETRGEGRRGRGRWAHDRGVTCNCCGPTSVKWMCLLAYVTGWIGGLIIALSEKRCYYLVFHACQSMVISSIYCILAAVFAVIDHLVIRSLAFSVVSFVWWCLYVILLVVCIIYAWTNADSGDLFQIVGLGSLAEKMADKFFSIGNAAMSQEDNDDI